MPMPDVDVNAGYIRQIQHLSNLREKSYNVDMVRETELLKLKIENLKKYNSLREESAKKLAAKDLVYTQTTFDERKKKLEEETNAALDAIQQKYDKERAEIDKKKSSGAISAADAAAQKAALKQKQAAEAQEAKNRQKQNEKELTEKFKLGKKLQAQQDKENLAAAYKNIQAEAKERGLRGKEAQEFISQQAKELGIDETKAKKTANQTQKAEKLVDTFDKLADYAKQLDSKIDSIAEMQTAVDTRLQGSKNKTKVTITGAKSYWMRLSDTITGSVGVSPYIKQSDIVDKVKELVSSGIAFDVEQRAFLATISDKIATTFDANDSTLRRLIRLQQQDSTAARLGMESAMNAFLNNMYENTEYLGSLSSSVRGQLEEAQALLSTEQAVELEFQVQKWLGSMYSVGVSDSTINKLATAIGQLASGDISGITSGGANNLLIMAANEAGISLEGILKNGLDASQTNILLQAMVNYLANIYNETKGSKVLQQQFANVYNLTASDLKAVTNLANDNNQTIKAIANNNLTFSTAYTQLQNMANTMYQRMSLGGMLDNVWDNFNYTIAEGMASNPVLYAIYKSAGLLDSVAGGIALPDIKVLGTGVNLQTTVADLMRVGAMSGSILSGIAKMIVAGNFSSGFSGAGLLKAFGIGSDLQTVSRGKGGGLATSGVTVSSSGFVGNAEEGVVYNKTMSDADDSAKKQLIEAKEDVEEDTTRKVVDEHIVQIYELLKSVIDGTNKFNVTFEESSSWRP